MSMYRTRHVVILTIAIVAQDGGGNGGVTELAQWFNAASMVRVQTSQDDKIDIGSWAMQKMLEILLDQTHIEM